MESYGRCANDGNGIVALGPETRAGCRNGGPAGTKSTRAKLRQSRLNADMKAANILVAALLVITAALTFNQWRLQRTLAELREQTAREGATAAEVEAFERLEQATAHFEQTRSESEQARHHLGEVTRRIARLEGALANGGHLPVRPEHPGGRRPLREDVVFMEPDVDVDPAGSPPNGSKRSWGPEQAAGAPDTFQAGDISTAWAALERDAGEEWLQLEYERAVDIAEIRVRETYNPGAVSKITALLPNGGETTLWEGVEPPSEAPVEMTFQVPPGVNANSIKVYLDTRRVPGWNEIDAVELIGRDGTRQWAKQASASSTYAEQGRRRL